MPGTTATADLRMTAAVRAAVARAEHPDLREIPGVPAAHSPHGALLAAGHPARAATATAATTAALQRHMAHELRLAGTQSGAYVYDMTTGEPLFAERATQRHPPASVEKLYTAVTALERMGPTAQLETTVLGVGKLAAGGVWQGDLYLRGGGDPTFGSAAFIRSHYGGVGTSVSALAAQVKAAGIERVTGKVYGDESEFDSLRGEPSSGYAWDPYLEGDLSALAFNRGETGNEKGAHAPAAYAARQLRAALRAAGVAVEHGGGAASAPAGAVRLVGALSPTIDQLLGLTLPPSDNFFAETLLKDLGARYGGSSPGAAGSTPGGTTTTAPTGTTAPGGTTPSAEGTATSPGATTAAPGGTTPGPEGTTNSPAGTTAPTPAPAATGSPAPVTGTTARGAKVVRETIAELGVHPKVVDGSGLSEEDRTSPYEVVGLLNEIAHTELGTVLRGDLAQAGQTGTLAERMRGTAAEGRCQAKTGTLTGVSNLAGYCTAADGDELAFAFFNDGISIEAAHTLQDNMAITLANY
jgi:D-alanyl-D-alanine carboxypeptidase/D-alanyl-D-alanine-endopeptidase (penicillin-binding protein 4)